MEAYFSLTMPTENYVHSVDTLQDLLQDQKAQFIEQVLFELESGPELTGP